jgi:two-component system sensor histidine kinase MprB
VPTPIFKWSHRMAFRTRVAILAAAAVAVAVALASSASYLAVRRQLYSQVDSTLQHEADVVRNSSSPTDTLRALQGSSDFQRSGVSGTLLYQIVRIDSNTPLRTGVPLPVSSGDAEVQNGQRDDFIRTAQGPGGIGPVRVYSIPVQTLGFGPGVLQLALPLHDVNHTLDKLSVLLFLLAACGVGLALFLGYLVARSSLAPVERLTRAAEHVAATQDLDATIEVTGDDELARLAASFNAMLAALAASRRQQAQLVADAGHELRTPLTSLRTNIEVLMKMRDLPEGDRQALLGDVTGQLEELTTLVRDVVELARQDEQQPEPQDLRLDLIVDRAIERARRRAPSIRFDTRIERGLVRGQPALLERAILNLFDNATKWSPPGASIEVWLGRNGADWTLQVRDHGPGIAPDDLPHVFERFYRAAAARALPGSGLGLAIVAQVVESHGGTVAIFSPHDGGTLVVLTLPALDTAAPFDEPSDQINAPSFTPT